MYNPTAHLNNKKRKAADQALARPPRPRRYTPEEFEYLDIGLPRRSDQEVLPVDLDSNSARTLIMQIASVIRHRQNEFRAHEARTNLSPMIPSRKLLDKVLNESPEDTARTLVAWMASDTVDILGQPQWTWDHFANIFGPSASDLGLKILYLKLTRSHGELPTPYTGIGTASGGGGSRAWGYELVMRRKVQGLELQASHAGEYHIEEMHKEGVEVLFRVIAVFPEEVSNYQVQYYEGVVVDWIESGNDIDNLTSTTYKSKRNLVPNRNIKPTGINHIHPWAQLSGAYARFRASTPRLAGPLLADDDKVTSAKQFLEIILEAHREADGRYFCCGRRRADLNDNRPMLNASAVTGIKGQYPTVPIKFGGYDVFVKIPSFPADAIFCNKCWRSFRTFREQLSVSEIRSRCQEMVRDGSNFKVF